jgi:hypothetical protein
MSKPPLKILLAAPRGFCAGVVRAIDIVERALALYGAPVYVRHEIVHNRFVVESLEAKGAVFVDELDDVPADRPVVFSAHGVPKSVPAEAERRAEEYAECFGGNRVLPGAEPAAHCYCGHQFGHFAGQLGDWVNRPEYVGLMGDGEHFDPLEQGVDVVQHQTPLGINGDGAQYSTSALGDELPRHNVGVMLHLAQQNYITSPQITPTPRMSHQINGFGGIAGENHLAVVSGVDKQRHPSPRPFEFERGLFTQLVYATMHIGVGGAVIVCQRRNHRFGFLRR